MDSVYILSQWMKQSLDIFFNPCSHILIIGQKCQMWLHDRVNRVCFIGMHVGIITNVMGIFEKVTIFSATCNCLLPNVISYFVMRDALFLKLLWTTHIVTNYFNLGILWWHFSILSCHVTWVQLFILWLFHETWMGGYNVYYNHMGGYNEVFETRRYASRIPHKPIYLNLAWALDECIWQPLK